MLMPITKTLYTVEDVEALEGEYELDRGMLVPMNPPKPLHGLLVVRFAARLHAYAESSGLGVVYADSGYWLEQDPDTLRGPDVSFVGRERAAGHDPRNYYTHAPDLAVEILSPSNTPGQVQRKVGQYLDTGAQLVWVVYGERGKIAAHRPDGDIALYSGYDVLTAEGVLPGFEWSLAEIFADHLPRRDEL